MGLSARSLASARSLDLTGLQRFVISVTCIVLSSWEIDLYYTHNYIYFLQNDITAWSCTTTDFCALRSPTSAQLSDSERSHDNITNRSSSTSVTASASVVPFSSKEKTNNFHIQIQKSRIPLATAPAQALFPNRTHHRKEGRTNPPRHDPTMGLHRKDRLPGR